MRLEVMLVMAHLIITLFLIGGYVYSIVVLNQPDETLKLAIMTVLGYWFGALGNDKRKEYKVVEKKGEKAK